MFNESNTPQNIFSAKGITVRSFAYLYIIDKYNSHIKERDTSIRWCVKRNVIPYLLFGSGIIKLLLLLIIYWSLIWGKEFGTGVKDINLISLLVKNNKNSHALGEIVNTFHLSQRQTNPINNTVFNDFIKAYQQIKCLRDNHFFYF